MSWIVPVWMIVLVSPPAGSVPARQAAGLVTGVTIDARTGTPLPAVDVRSEGGTSVSSDPSGRFRLVVAPGRSRLTFEIVGYAVEERTVELRAGESVALRVVLAPGPARFEAATDVVGTGAPASEVGVSTVTLDAGHLADLRGVLTDDPFRALQAAPGIVATDDFRGEVGVRGWGPPHQTVTLDGVELLQPWHSVRGGSDTGSISRVQADVLEQVSVVASPAPVEAPARLGPSIRFVSREALSEPSVAATIGAAATSLTAAGPAGTGARAGWLVSLRRSYLGWLLRALDPESDNAFNFTDGFGKLRWRPSGRQAYRAWFLAGRSVLDDDAAAGDSDVRRATTSGGTASLQGEWMPARAWTMSQALSASIDRHRNAAADGRPLDEGRERWTDWRTTARTSRAWGSVDLGADARWRQAHRLVRTFDGAAPRVAVDGSASDRLAGAWFHVRWAVTPAVVLAPGARVERRTGTLATSTSAWLLGEWAVGPATQVQASFSRVEQVPEPGQMLIASPRSLAAERSTGVEGSFSTTPARGWHVEVAAYARHEDGRLIAPAGEWRVLDGIVVREAAVGWWQGGRSRAWGASLRAERTSTTGLSGWIAYAYGRTELRDPERGETFPEAWDQRHALTAFGAFGVSGHLRASARLRVGSGLPLPGYFERVGDDYYVGDQRNQVRLQPYARLDVRVDRTWHWGGRRVTAFVEILNVLNRRNVAPTDTFVDVRYGRVRAPVESLLPLLPIAGLRIDFR
ncbi:MAG: carboxypeptidase-like regulatory domain-containing protein [Vicinamibacterales bacterium]